MNEISEKIKTARLAAGMTQKQLGEAMGYQGKTGVRTVQRWEAGDKYVPHEQMRQLAGILNIPLESLIP